MSGPTQQASADGTGKGVTWSPVNSVRLGVCALLLVLATAGAFVLYHFEPGRAGIYPVCLFHRVTGLWCPGCGALRATHQLLHGHVVAALHFNALFVVMLPFLGWFTVRSMVGVVSGKPIRFEIRPWWLWVGLVVMVCFGVVRNLPFASVLAPP